REGYAKQVESLQIENRALRSDLAELEERHASYRQLCHAETDQLRAHVVALENRVAGLLRKLADLAIRASRGEVNAEVAASIVQMATESAAPAMKTGSPP